MTPGRAPRTRPTRLSTALALALLLACGADRVEHGVSQGNTADGGPAGDVLSGSVAGDVGHPPPLVARTVVIWQGGRGGAERLYKHGDGTATASSFRLTLSTPPPTEALVNGQTGLGYVFLLPANLSLPDGAITGPWLEQNAIGAVPESLVVYRGPLGPAYTWLTAFPLGYSCAARDPGESHAHTPDACSALRLYVGDVDTFSFVGY